MTSVLPSSTFRGCSIALQAHYTQHAAISAAGRTLICFISAMATIAAAFPTSAMLERVPSRDHFVQVTTMRGIPNIPSKHERSENDAHRAPSPKRQRIDEGTSTDDEDAAELLLNMGIAVVAPPQHPPSPADSHDSDYSPRPIRRHSDYVCMQCLGPVTVSGERRPTFVCTHCRSKTGYSKRAHKALLAADLRVEVTAYDAAHRSGGRSGSPQAREDSGASSRDAAGPATMGEGEEQEVDEAVGLQGRCKCGMYI